MIHLPRVFSWEPKLFLKDIQSDLGGWDLISTLHPSLASLVITQRQIPWKLAIGDNT